MACSCCGHSMPNAFFNCTPISQHHRFPESCQPSGKQKWEFQSQKSTVNDVKELPNTYSETKISFGYHGQPHSVTHCFNHPVYNHAIPGESERFTTVPSRENTFNTQTSTQIAMLENRRFESPQIYNASKSITDKQKQPQNRSMNFQGGSQMRKRNIDTCIEFKQTNRYNTGDMSNSKKTLVLDESLRVITIQIKRLRGISVQLKRCLAFDILFELFGKCISRVEYFTHLPGFQFVLQELRSTASGATVNCAFYDFDEQSPTVESGKTYRCVGKYHSNHRIFQCFMIEECDAESIRLMELFESHSDREVTKLIETSTKNNATNCKVVKIPYMGLEPSRYSKKMPPNTWGQQNRFAQ